MNKSEVLKWLEAKGTRATVAGMALPSPFCNSLRSSMAISESMPSSENP